MLSSSRANALVSIMLEVASRLRIVIRSSSNPRPSWMPRAM
jgi:hypothetical protein